MAKKGFLEGYKTYDTSGGYGNARKWKGAFNQRFSRQEAESLLADQPETPHQILGVPAGATQAEIKKAFRALIIIWHPDRNPQRLSEAEQMSKKIIAAYSLLSS